MLKDVAIENLKLALEQLDEPDSCGAWNVLEPLRRLSDDGMDIMIDLRASNEVGAPVIVATLRGSPGPDLSRLTPRQQRVAGLILEGQTNKAIARALGISPATVKDHVHAILTRLELSSRAALISSALPGRR